MAVTSKLMKLGSSLKGMPTGHHCFRHYYRPFQFVEFPARFLASLFSECIQNYRKPLEATCKVPPGVHYEIFPEDTFNHLEFLAEDLLPKGRIAVPR